MTGSDLDPWADAKRDAVALVETAERARQEGADISQAVADARLIMRQLDRDQLERTLIALAGITAEVAPPRRGFTRDWIALQHGGMPDDGT
jgi:hypothetical protein